MGRDFCSPAPIFVVELWLKRCLGMAGRVRRCVDIRKYGFTGVVLSAAGCYGKSMAREVFIDPTDKDAVNSRIEIRHNRRNS